VIAIDAWLLTRFFLAAQRDEVTNAA
jgi:hypothetical protein